MTLEMCFNLVMVGMRKNFGSHLRIHKTVPEAFSSFPAEADQEVPRLEDISTNHVTPNEKEKETI